MTTLIVNIKNSTEARKVADALRLMKSVENVEIEEELPDDLIPDFPYTDEEKVDSVRQAMEEMRSGARGYSIDEVRAMIAQ